jgi:hypothetical protein
MTLRLFPGSILAVPGGLSGEGPENRAERTLATNGGCKGHSERPLAEVISQMPRCAPLRLTQGAACRVPSLRRCQHAFLER